MTKNTRRSLAEWQTIIQQQKSSGQSTVLFCAEHGLCSKTFYKYRRDIQTGEKIVLKPKGFIKIKKSPALKPSTVTDSFCVLHYQSCRLQFDSTTDASWLAQVMKALS